MKQADRRMPVLFIGHGSPMHAVHDNTFTKTLARLGREIPAPKAVLCISAHWLTERTWATHMPKPKTIHDFGGFPQELFDIEYPAPGSPLTAELLRDTVADPAIRMDDEMWGLDHGTWAVLRHMYPKADVPVVQLSVYFEQPGSYHLALGRKLAKLRDRGVLILGSGNVVHNLRTIKWSAHPEPYPWAVEFDAFVKRKTEEGDPEALAKDPAGMPGGAMSVPEPDHWYPYLYSLGAADGDPVHWEYEGLENGSISMRCASFGLTVLKK